MQAQLAFMKIWGVGPKNAQSLVHKQGITSIGELRVRPVFCLGVVCLQY